MKTGSIDLAVSNIIPKEGYFKAIGREFSVDIYSADLGAASITFGLKGSAEGTRFGTVQSGGSDISETVASGVTCFRTFEVDPESFYYIELASGTGTVLYNINE